MEKKITHKQLEECKTKTTTDPSLLWDCGSTLYDSFELNSLKRQLDSAITSSRRSISMPHLPPPPLIPSNSKMSRSSSTSKISRSLNKFLRVILFRSNNKHSFKDRFGDHQLYAVYDMSGALTTIPEVPEIDFGAGALSPDINSLLERSASQRFTSAASNIGISCV